MIKAFAALEPGGRLTAFNYEPGPLKAQEVEIEVVSCGICHSDISIIDNAWGNSVFPIVPGHEVIGVIRALGAGVQHLQQDQMVGLGWHSGYCFACDFCDSGDHNLCVSPVATINGHFGGFADRVRADSRSVVPLPKNLDPNLSGPLFCGGITVFNPLLQYDIKATAKVAVIGIGGLGHMALQFLKAWGCHVTAFSSSPEKRQRLLEQGVDACLDSNNPSDLESAIGQFDLILSTVNVSLDWNRYLLTLAPRGRLHFVGAVLEPINIQAFYLIGGQRSVSGSPVGSPASIRKMLAFAEQHQLVPEVETFAFRDPNKAIEQVRAGNVRHRAVLVR